MKKYYNVEPQTVNFQDTAEYARKEINLWAEHQTAGKVQIIAQAFIKKLASFILLFCILQDVGVIIW